MTESVTDPETLRELAGEEPLDRQDGILDPDQVDVDQGQVTDTELDEGESSRGGPFDSVDRAASIEMLEDLDLRADETTDATVAAEEGLPWVPPMDPPVVAADNAEGVMVAAGFGASADATPYDADHHSELLTAEDEVTERVREALRADSTTTAYADSLEIETQGGVVVLRGIVEDIDDGDNLVAVASQVTGITDVIDETDVAGL